MAGPLIAPITGTAQSRIAQNASRATRPRSSCGPGGPAVRSLSMARRSAPPTNARVPAPVRIGDPHVAVLAERPERVADAPPASSGSTALTGGRSMVTVATWSAVSTRTAGSASCLGHGSGRAASCCGPASSAAG